MSDMWITAACEDCGWMANSVGTLAVAQDHADQRGHAVRYTTQGRVLPVRTWRDASPDVAQVDAELTRLRTLEAKVMAARQDESTGQYVRESVERRLAEEEKP